MIPATPSLQLTFISCQFCFPKQQEATTRAQGCDAGAQAKLRRPRDWWGWEISGRAAVWPLAIPFLPDSPPLTSSFSSIFSCFLVPTLPCRKELTFPKQKLSLWAQIVLLFIRPSLIKTPLLLHWWLSCEHTLGNMVLKIDVCMRTNTKYPRGLVTNS